MNVPSREPDREVGHAVLVEPLVVVDDVLALELVEMTTHEQLR
jgi:hypothetical protein